jgi:non-ribosomal peptide synthetase component F
VRLVEVQDAEVRPDGLRGRRLAAADLFDAGTAAAVASRFTRVLAVVASDPAVRVREVGVLDAAERSQLVAGWNDTAAEVPAGSVAELVMARAQQNDLAYLFRLPMMANVKRSLE